MKTKIRTRKTIKLNYCIIVGCIIVFMLLILPAITIGQPGLPSDPEQEIPIDGGLGILAAAGGAYAIKKLRDKRKE